MKQLLVKIHILFFLFSLLLIACDDSGKTDRKTDGETSSAFNLGGIVAPAVPPEGLSPRLSPGFNAALASGLTADYVYAVNTSPEYGQEWRKLAPINNDGSFEIVLTKGDPWVVAFIDSTQIGSDMILGILKAETLDTVAPRTDESAEGTDLGTVTVDEASSEAMVETDMYSTFIGNLGMTTEGAGLLGTIDDLMLRFINPDIDGDGGIDLNQVDFPQWVSITYWLGYTFGDLTENGDSIRSGGGISTTGTVTFDGSNPQIWAAAGSAYESYTHFNFYTDDGSGPEKIITRERWVSNGLYFDPGQSGTVFYDPPSGKLPEGEYIYKFYTNETDANNEVDEALTLTFTHVKTIADVNDPVNFVFPFPRYNADESGDITAIEVTWKRYDGSEFVDATAEDIEMFVGKNTAEIKWYTDDILQNDDHGCFITLNPSGNDFAPVFAIDPDSGSWGVSATRKRSDIRDLAIAFTSKLGLFIKMTVTD